MTTAATVERPTAQPLTSRRQWLIYRTAPSATRPGKTDKIPVNPRTGYDCNAHDPTVWVSHAEAVAAAARYGMGLAFVLTAADPLFCLDIDGCLQADNTWSPLAISLCQAFPGAMVEVSQSGRGLHVWGSYSGAMPPHKTRNCHIGAELYHEARFIAMGSNATGDAGTDCTAALLIAIDLYFKPDATPAGPAADWTGGPVDGARPIAGDAELIRRACSSRQSMQGALQGRATFEELWAGNADALARAFPDGGGQGRAYDASSADAALAQHLAFWTGNDCDRIDRLMRQSALARDKWGRADYLPRTILAACARQKQWYVEPAASAPAGAPAGAVALGSSDGTDLGPDDGAPVAFNPWVQCIVPEGELTLWAGHGGTGKSTLALLLALCIATGRPFLGLTTRRGRVLFYSAEDPAKPLRIRLRALCERYGIAPAELGGWLTVTDMTEGDPVLYRGTGATDALVRLRERIERDRFDVVILDNASDVFDGNENERPRVRHFVRLCRQLIAAREGAVILPTHVDKSTAKGFGSGQGYSGSTAWHNSCRSRLFLVREDDGTITLEHHKANYGALAASIRLRWDGCVPVPLASDPVASADVALWSVVALVFEFDGRGEPVPVATSGPSTAYHLFSTAAGYPRGMKAAQLFEVLREAERRQLIRREFYRDANRKERTRWRPVICGSAPVAPVAN